ncbi:hypothetical protein GFS60_07653 (plasmid) [Rhodococcus sp. WAY2]|nr:hypothetical protein GFS60_07653 [Rhodococcus sp. WAY2]
MNPADHLATVVAPAAENASSFGVLISLAALILAVLIPMSAIAFAVLRNSSPSGPDAEIGLGTVSLHDEMWQFIADVERGTITLSSLEANKDAPCAVAKRSSWQQEELPS